MKAPPIALLAQESMMSSNFFVWSLGGPSGAWFGGTLKSKATARVVRCEYTGTGLRGYHYSKGDKVAQRGARARASEILCQLISEWCSKRPRFSAN